MTTMLEPISDGPPVRVRRPVMLMDWRVLTAIHWRIEPEVAAARLPDGLEPDLFDGSAWVGLIPFHMRDIRLAGMPRGIPWIGSFPETNIRTYVTARDGGRGIWFDSLDITRVGAVAVARLGYQLPYQWGRMSIARDGRRFTYDAARRWEGTPTSRVVVDVGPPVATTDRTPLDEFLANRWSLYADGPAGVLRAHVDHGPWPLFEASVVELRDEFATAAGYDLQGPPGQVRFSPGVDVRIGLPHRVRT